MMEMGAIIQKLNRLCRISILCRRTLCGNWGILGGRLVTSAILKRGDRLL